MRVLLINWIPLYLYRSSFVHHRKLKSRDSRLADRRLPAIKFIAAPTPPGQTVRCVSSGVLCRVKVTFGWELEYYYCFNDLFTFCK